MDALLVPHDFDYHLSPPPLLILPLGDVKELNRFGLCNGMDFTGLSVSKMLTILDGLLRWIFLEGSICKVSSIKWQASYMLCVHLCTVEQDSGSEQAIFDMIGVILREEGARLDTTSRTSRQIARYLTPQLRASLLFMIWVLNSVGTSAKHFPAEIKLKIFLYSLDLGNVPKKEGGCNAVLGACSYLARFWVPKHGDMFSNDKTKWGDELIMQLLPDVFTGTTQNDAPINLVCDALILDADGMLIYCKHAGAISSVIAMHASSCGNNNPIILPKHLSHPRLVKKVAEFCLLHSQASEVDFNKVDMLFELIEISSYLDMSVLLGLACKKVANMINGKSCEEIGQAFGTKK
jgi:hypothetical protein